MKINATWHKNHRMPKNPTLNQRIQWHQEHVNHCICRPIPQKLQELMKK